MGTIYRSMPIGVWGRTCPIADRIALRKLGGGSTAAGKTQVRAPFAADLIRAGHALLQMTCEPATPGLIEASVAYAVIIALIVHIVRRTSCESLADQAVLDPDIRCTQGPYDWTARVREYASAV